MKAAFAILGVLVAGLALALLVQTAELSKLGKKHDEVVKQLEKAEAELRDAKKKIEVLEQAEGRAAPDAGEGREGT